MSTNDIHQTSTPDADNCGALRTKSGQGIGPNERATVEALAEAWNRFMRLDGRDYEMERDFRQSINRAQDIIAYRVASRIDPDLWKQLPPAPPPLRGRPGVIDLLRKVTGDPMAEPAPPAPGEEPCKRCGQEPYPEAIRECIKRGTGECELARRITPPAERPTPETDAFRDQSFLDRVDELDRLYHHAETLEIQLAEAREQRDELANALETLKSCHLTGYAAEIINTALAAVKETTIAGFNVIADPTLPPGAGEISDPKTGEVIAAIKVGMNASVMARPDGSPNT